MQPRCQRWDGGLMNRSYKWVEKVVAFEPEMQECQSTVRDGLLEAGVKPNNGFTYDHVYGTKVGDTIFDRDGHRHTAADLLKYADPRRLTVLLHATMERIVFDRREKGKPVARGVVFMDSGRGRHRAYLKRGEMNEVVMASGVLGSTQLLMLSGVGPREHLEAMGIRMVEGNEMVGEGMSDNLMNTIFVPLPLPMELSLIQVVGITEYETYIETASGAFFSPSSSKGSNLARNFGMLSAQTGQLFAVPPKQRTPEVIPKATEAMNNLPDSNFIGGFILEKIIGPVSTGHLKLKNRNPYHNPSVTFNYFKEPKDLLRCVAGIKTIERVIQSSTFTKFTYPYFTIEALLNLTTNFPVNLLPRHKNDLTFLEQFCKDTVMSIWHYHGGCRVGQVVDHEYMVLGVDALSVIDGSTFNYTPGTNP